MRPIADNKGSATLLTMFMAAVIITVGISFNWLVKEHMKASEALKIKSEAILKARSAYDTLIYLMLSGSLSQREIRIDAPDEISPLTRIPVDGQKVSLAPDIFVQIQDSNGKLSLATVNQTAMERLIRTVGGREDSSSIFNSYLDWIDEDDFSRLNGAEEYYYRSQGLPVPRNYAIQFKDELQWVKGMDGGLYGKLEPNFTILPATGFNPNTAAEPVLKAYLNLDEESLKPLKEYLAQRNVRSDVELFALTGRRIASGVDFGHFFPSLFFEIKVSVGAPKNIYTIQAGLDTRQKLRTPYEVLYWIEE
ncbi:MAG: type II secretion system protein GspK [Deltaproteobacteria bacterium]|nr:type II secretion system protein GspK [Deltaproteobacteria bacterium]